MSFQFDSLMAFLLMEIDGRVHGPYVWAAYLITLGGIGGIVLNLRLARKRFIKQQAALLRRRAPQTEHVG